MLKPRNEKLGTSPPTNLPKKSSTILSAKLIPKTILEKECKLTKTHLFRMRSVSPFNADNEITLWIKKTCLTIDYKNPPELLRTMNYLCSYLICQLRESHFITPPDKKPAIVFMLRNMKSVNKCINSLIPTVTLDKVVISLPSTKEFLILNGTELEDGDTYSRFKDLAFFPSGIMEVLPKPFELNHPSPNIPWEDVWANIKKETSETQRRSFCSSFYSKSSICEDQEENLKRNRNNL